MMKTKKLGKKQIRKLLSKHPKIKKFLKDPKNVKTLIEILPLLIGLIFVYTVKKALLYNISENDG